MEEKRELRKIICGIIIVLLAISVFPLALNVQTAKAAGGTIYIRASGLVEPPSAPISARCFGYIARMKYLFGTKN